MKNGIEYYLPGIFDGDTPPPNVSWPKGAAVPYGGTFRNAMPLFTLGYYIPEASFCTSHRRVRFRVFRAVLMQGLEEMKETAREINEAVALGKETEAGINEASQST